LRQLLLVRVDVDAPVGALARAEHAGGAVLLQQRDDAARTLRQRRLLVRVLAGVRAPREHPGGRAPSPHQAPHDSTTPPTPTPVTASWSSATGSSTNQAKRCSWSSRTRGQATRNQRKTTPTAVAFSSVQSTPTTATSPQGPRQPPRKSTVNSSAMTTMPAYSASRKKAKRSPVYSVSGPKTTSESAIGASKGVRCSSATLAARKTKAAGACHSSHHQDHSWTMPVSDRVPAAIATLAAAITSGSS